MTEPPNLLTALRASLEAALPADRRSASAEVRDPADAEAWAIWDQARAIADRLDPTQRDLLAELADRLVTEQPTPDPAERVLREDDPLDDLIDAGLVDLGTWRLTDLGETVHDGLTTGRWEP